MDEDAELGPDVARKPGRQKADDQLLSNLKNASKTAPYTKES